MSTSSESIGWKGRLVRFLSHHPIAVIVGLVGGLASIVNLFAYLHENKTRELTYYVHPVRAIVVKTGEASRLSVAYDGKDVTTDVAAVQVAVWNQGREAIRKSDVLRPLVINTAVPILEAVVRKETRPGIIGMKLDESEEESGRLGVSWDILEEDDGGVIQLILAGPPDAKVTAEAVIVGQREIQEFAFHGAIKSPTEQYSAVMREQVFGRFQLLVQALVVIVLGVFLVFNMRRGAIISRHSVDRFLLTIIIIASLFLFLGLYNLFRALPTPPFDF